MKDETKALAQELEQAKADLRTAQLSLAAANREIEDLKARLNVLTAAEPQEAPRRGRPPKKAE